MLITITFTILAVFALNFPSEILAAEVEPDEILEDNENDEIDSPFYTLDDLEITEEDSENITDTEVLEDLEPEPEPESEPEPEPEPEIEQELDLQEEEQGEARGDAEPEQHPVDSGSAGNTVEEQETADNSGILEAVSSLNYNLHVLSSQLAMSFGLITGILLFNGIFK